MTDSVLPFQQPVQNQQNVPGDPRFVDYSGNTQRPSPHCGLNTQGFQGQVAPTPTSNTNLPPGYQFLLPGQLPGQQNPIYFNSPPTIVMGPTGNYAKVFAPPVMATPAVINAAIADPGSPYFKQAMNLTFGDQWQMSRGNVVGLSGITGTITTGNNVDPLTGLLQGPQHTLPVSGTPGNIVMEPTFNLNRLLSVSHGAVSDIGGVMIDARYNVITRSPSGWYTVEAPTSVSNPFPKSTPEWYNFDIAARERAAVQNTVMNPVTPKTPGYQDYYAPPKVLNPADVALSGWTRTGLASDLWDKYHYQFTQQQEDFINSAWVIGKRESDNFFSLATYQASEKTPSSTYSTYETPNPFKDPLGWIGGASGLLYRMITVPWRSENIPLGVGLVAGGPEEITESGIARVATESEIMQMIKPTQKVLPEWLGYELKELPLRPATTEEIAKMVVSTKTAATEAQIINYLKGGLLDIGAPVAVGLTAFGAQGNKSPLLTMPWYQMLHSTSLWWGDNIGKPFESLTAPLTQPTALSTERWIEHNRLSLVALSFIPTMGLSLGYLNNNPFNLETPSKLKSASGAFAVSAPEQFLEFTGMFPVGVETLARNPLIFPEMAVAGLTMQAEGIQKGWEENPTKFLYEQLAMVGFFEGARETAFSASPIGAGAYEVPPLVEGGRPTTFYAIYTKTPFAAEGGEPWLMAGLAKRAGGWEAVALKTNWVTRTPLYSEATYPRTIFTDVPDTNPFRTVGYDLYPERSTYSLQSPIGAGRINFLNPEDAQLGFVAVRSPIAKYNIPSESFGVGYVKSPEAGTSVFVGSPSKQTSGLISEGWEYGKWRPLEYERGYFPGFTAAERFVLEPLLYNTSEWNMIEDVRAAQNYLVSATPGSTLTQKNSYSYQPTLLTKEATDAFFEVLQRPEYKGRVVVGGSTVSENYVPSGKFRPLLGKSDIDLFIPEELLEPLAGDLGEAMQNVQDNLNFTGDFEKVGGPGLFRIEVENALGENIPVIEAHTFTEFPNVQKQTVWMDLEGGGSFRAVAPEYSLRSKLAGSIESFKYGKEGAELSYKGMSNFPDVISLSRQMGMDTAKSTMFNRVARSYEDYLFGEGMKTQARNKAEILFSKEEWKVDNPDTTLEELVRQNFENVDKYRTIVKGFDNLPIDIPQWDRFNAATNRGVAGVSTTIRTPGTERALIGYRTSINWGGIRNSLTPSPRFFTGSPGEILRDVGFRISPSMETVGGQWSNTQHAIFDRYLIDRLSPEQSRIVKTASPAINSAFSRLFTPEQRELFGAVKTTSASRETMANLLTLISEDAELRKGWIFGGSRAQRVWVGSAGRYESMFGSDFDAYGPDLRTVNKGYHVAVDELQKEFPGIENLKGTHHAASPDLTKAQASIVTNPKDEFIHLKPIQAYPFMKEGGFVEMDAIGGAKVAGINPRLLLKRAVGGMFSSIDQAPGGLPELILSRPKDIAAAYPMSRSFAETLYKPSTVDAGGIITRMKISRASALEDYSLALYDYVKTLKGAQGKEVVGMFGEMRTDPLRGVNRHPEPMIDLITGKGIMADMHGMSNEDAMLFPGRKTESSSAVGFWDEVKSGNQKEGWGYIAHITEKGNIESIRESGLTYPRDKGLSYTAFYTKELSEIPKTLKDIGSLGTFGEEVNLYTNPDKYSAVIMRIRDADWIKRMGPTGESQTAIEFGESFKGGLTNRELIRPHSALLGEMGGVERYSGVHFFKSLDLSDIIKIETINRDSTTIPGIENLISKEETQPRQTAFGDSDLSTYKYTRTARDGYGGYLDVGASLVASGRYYTQNRESNYTRSVLTPSFYRGFYPSGSNSGYPAGNYPAKYPTTYTSGYTPGYSAGNYPNKYPTTYTQGYTPGYPAGNYPAKYPTTYTQGYPPSYPPGNYTTKPLTRTPPLTTTWGGGVGIPPIPYPLKEQKDWQKPKKTPRRFYRMFNEKIIGIDLRHVNPATGMGARLPYLETRKRGFLEPSSVIAKRAAKLPESMDIVRTSQKMAKIQKNAYIRQDIGPVFGDMSNPRIRKAVLGKKWSSGLR